MEEFRLALWQRLGRSRQRCGNTFFVKESDWIAGFRNTEPLLELKARGTLRHYVIATEDDVVEVISSQQPSIETLGDAPEGEPPAGRSVVLYNPHDRSEIETLLNNTKNEYGPQT